MATGRDSQIDVLLERVDNLRSDISEIKIIVGNMADSERQRSEKIVELSQSTKRAHERIDELSDWQKKVNDLMPFLKAEAWIIAALAVPVIVWLASVVYQYLLAKAGGVL